MNNKKSSSGNSDESGRSNISSALFLDFDQRQKNVRRSKRQQVRPVKGAAVVLQPLLKVKQGISLQRYDKNEELDIYKCIVAREICLDQLVKQLCIFTQDNRIDIANTCIQLRTISLLTIEKIAIWRTALVKPEPFMYNNINYVLGMATDTDFITKSKRMNETFPIKLDKRNPFLTLSGMDHKLQLYRDDGVKEGKYFPDESASIWERIEQAENLILYEESIHGKLKLPTQKRQGLILSKEAEFRKGLNQKDSSGNKNNNVKKDSNGGEQT